MYEELKFLLMEYRQSFKLIIIYLLRFHHFSEFLNIFEDINKKMKFNKGVNKYFKTT